MKQFTLVLSLVVMTGTVQTFAKGGGTSGGGNGVIECLTRALPFLSATPSDDTNSGYYFDRTSLSLIESCGLNAEQAECVSEGLQKTLLFNPESCIK